MLNILINLSVLYDGLSYSTLQHITTNILYGCVGIDSELTNMLVDMTTVPSATPRAVFLIVAPDRFGSLVLKL